MAHSNTYQIDDHAHTVCTDHTEDWELDGRLVGSWRDMPEAEVSKFRTFWTKELGETRDICELSDFDF